MITVGIIAEYNPFHNGHKRQIEAVRRFFEDDVTVIALMSGNFVQRGEFSVLPKGYRAKAALLGGVDLVLEYPYPWSGASAESFAEGGVSILSKLGVEYLAFGSECGELSVLSAQADRLLSEEFNEALSRAVKTRPTVPYAVQREAVYASLYGESLSTRANDILGVAYLMAIKKQNAAMKPLVIKREGQESATASRMAYRRKDYEKLNSLVPQVSYDVLKEQCAVSLASLEKSILVHLRLCKRSDFVGVADLTDDLCYRMLSVAEREETLEGFFAAVASKSYTNARVRRALLAMLFRLRRERLMALPTFTRLLAAGPAGRRFLDGVDFPVLTRAGDSGRYGEAVRDQAAFADRADRIFAMADGNQALHKPFIL